MFANVQPFSNWSMAMIVSLMYIFQAFRTLAFQPLEAGIWKPIWQWLHPRPLSHQHPRPQRLLPSPSNIFLLKFIIGGRSQTTVTIFCPLLATYLPPLDICDGISISILGKICIPLTFIVQPVLPSLVNVVCECSLKRGFYSCSRAPKVFTRQICLRIKYRTRAIISRGFYIFHCGL